MITTDGTYISLPSDESGRQSWLPSEVMIALMINRMVYPAIVSR
jgi:hypothetical protein